MHIDILLRFEQIIALQQELLVALRAQAPDHWAQQDEWLDAADVKQLLKIGDTTLYRLTKNNRLAHKKIGGKRYYLKTAIFNHRV